MIEATRTPHDPPPDVGDYFPSPTGAPSGASPVQPEMPSGRQPPLEWGYARHGGRGSDPTVGGSRIVHVTRDGDGPGGEW